MMLHQHESHEPHEPHEPQNHANLKTSNVEAKE